MSSRDSHSNRESSHRTRKKKKRGTSIPLTSSAPTPVKETNSLKSFQPPPLRPAQDSTSAPNSTRSIGIQAKSVPSVHTGSLGDSDSARLTVTNFFF